MYTSHTNTLQSNHSSVKYLSEAMPGAIRKRLSRILSVIVTILLSTAIIVPLIASGDAAVAATQPSWNPHVGCPATLMTLEQLVGIVPNPAQSSPNQGADYSGGILQLAGIQSPGTNPASGSWPFSKRSLSPPCSVLVGGVVYPTLVEIHNVKLGSISLDECGAVFANTCDETFNSCNNILAPNCISSYPDTMHKVHTEIDMYWIHNGIAPPVPTAGSVIDVQGFVFWDDSHLDGSWHSFSGWEIHPLTAWRPAGSVPAPGPLSTSFTVSPASPIVGQAVSYVGSAIGGTSPYSFSWSFGDGASGTGASIAHSYTAAGTYSVQLTTRDSKSATATASRTVTVSGTGVTPDFSLNIVPGVVSISAGTYDTVSVGITSVGGLAGPVTFSAKTTTTGLNLGLSPSTITLAAGRSGSVLLTVSVAPSVPAGTYVVTIDASHGAVAHSVSLTVHVTNDENGNGSF